MIFFQKLFKGSRSRTIRVYFQHNGSANDAIHSLMTAHHFSVHEIAYEIIDEKLEMKEYQLNCSKTKDFDSFLKEAKKIVGVEHIKEITELNHN